MPFETIHKDPAAFQVPPNLVSYQDECANFSWECAGFGLDLDHSWRCRFS
jgi:hypothetical protein